METAGLEGECAETLIPFLNRFYLLQTNFDKSAYNNIPLFEGNDPVVALLEEYYASK